MFYRYGAIPLLAALLSSPLCGGEPTLAPREGVLLLRNGHVMRGGITRAGDFYVLTLGKTGEVRLPATDVEAQCVDLEDAYRYQAALLTAKKADPHLTLAEWCLRHGLPRQAEEQMEFARQLEPANGRISQIQLRLKLAAGAPPPGNARATGSSTTVGSEQLEETLKELPKGSVEKFSVIVQPMLINRCGANGCHGPASKSNFHLLRPSSGQVMSKRFTQRNLFSVLPYIDRKNPEESRLLTLPQERHGNTLTPIFDKKSQRQFDDLLAWAKHLAAEPPPLPLPATIGPPSPLLSQSGAEGEKRGDKTPRHIAPMNAGEKPAPPWIPGTAAEDKPSPGPGDPLAPRDPFDPEIFNRKYLPRMP